MSAKNVKRVEMILARMKKKMKLRIRNDDDDDVGVDLGGELNLCR